MIRDLSLTLEKILSSASTLREVDISFLRPLETFNPAKETINLFLYDIRENQELRSNEQIIQRDGNGQATIELPPLRVACSYLVTAWPGSGATDETGALREHELLSAALQRLAAFPTIPSHFLQGQLSTGQEPSLPMMTAQSNGLKEPAEFWTALGNQLRPSIAVTVTISMPVFEDITGPVVTTRFTQFGTGDGEQETWIQLGGEVRTPAAQAGQFDAVANALVDVLDVGLRTQADVEGRYSFLRIPPGEHSLRVVAVGFEPQTQTIYVPENASAQPENYQITLTPLNS
jgi:hypothetical protein